MQNSARARTLLVEPMELARHGEFARLFEQLWVYGGCKGSYWSFYIADFILRSQFRHRRRQTCPRGNRLFECL